MRSTLLGGRSTLSCCWAGSPWRTRERQGQPGQLDLWVRLLVVVEEGWQGGGVGSCRRMKGRQLVGAARAGGTRSAGEPRVTAWRIQRRARPS